MLISTRSQKSSESISKFDIKSSIFPTETQTNHKTREECALEIVDTQFFSISSAQQSVNSAIIAEYSQMISERLASPGLDNWCTVASDTGIRNFKKPQKQSTHLRCVYALRYKYRLGCCLLAV